jgi:hypothetical protein
MRNQGVTAVGLLDDQIEGIKARLYKCWEVLKEGGDVSGVGEGIEEEIAGLLVDYRVFERLHLSGNESSETSGNKRADMELQKDEELWMNERIECDWKTVDTLGIEDLATSHIELFEGQSSEQENEGQTEMVFLEN